MSGLGQSTRQALCNGESPWTRLFRGNVICTINFKLLILNTVLAKKYRCSGKGQNKAQLTRQLDKREKIKNTFARFPNLSN